MKSTSLVDSLHSIADNATFLGILGAQAAVQGHSQVTGQDVQSVVRENILRRMLLSALLQSQGKNLTQIKEVKKIAL